MQRCRIRLGWSPCLPRVCREREQRGGAPYSLPREGIEGLQRTDPKVNVPHHGAIAVLEVGVQDDVGVTAAYIPRGHPHSEPGTGWTASSAVGADL
jgi:hypothetical protein